MQKCFVTWIKIYDWRDFLASFPGSHAPEREHCAEESMVFFFSREDRQK